MQYASQKNILLEILHLKGQGYILSPTIEWFDSLLNGFNVPH